MVSNYIGIFAQKYLQIYYRGRLTSDVIKLLVLVTYHNFQFQFFINLMHMAQHFSFLITTIKQIKKPLSLFVPYYVYYIDIMWLGVHEEMPYIVNCMGAIICIQS